MTAHDPFTPLTDTPPAVRGDLVRWYRAMSHPAKLERVVQLTQAVQQLASMDLKRRHPEATERELQLRLASRWLDAEWMRRHLDWDPDIEGR